MARIGQGNARGFNLQKFSQKQSKLYTWWQKDSVVKDRAGIIADGAISSGKTIAMTFSFLLWAMRSFGNTNFGIAGKTISSCNRNVVETLKALCVKWNYQVIHNRSENCLTITRYDYDYKAKTLGKQYGTYRGRAIEKATNYFYIFGGKDESSQDLIQGITLGGCFLDEVVLMPESFVNQLTARCRVKGAKLWFNCNPDGPLHFFKQKFIDRAKDLGLLYLHFDFDDNLTLSEEIKARYRRTYTGVFYTRYVLGKWSVANGIVYDQFNAGLHCVDVDASLDNVGANDDVYISIDYGTQNATVFILWLRVGGKWTAVKEYYYSGRNEERQKTDREYAKDLIAFISYETGSGEKRLMDLTSIIIDPSAASFIAELKRQGLPIKKANNDVLDGIRVVSTLLNLEMIAFNKGLKRTMEEFYSYSWDSKASSRGVDTVVKQNDHCMDAIRYFCYTILRKELKTL